MKFRSRISFRASAVLLLIALTGCFLWAGVPALAADVAGTQNASPIAENLKFDTFRNIPINGQLTANDPEHDAIKFEIKEFPKKGTVNAETSGHFVYTPSDGKKGQDTFSYVAIDSAGNMSGKAVVTINIKNQSTKITYSDMTDNGSHYAALVLAEKGILVGEKLGNEYFFRPASTVTRGEFLTMCLAMTDTKTIPGITRTGFADDSSIPQWAKPYVSTALMNGVISGFKNTDGRLVFAPEEPITCSEASVILNNLLKVTDVASVPDVTRDTCPAWAYQAETNLAACRILTSDETKQTNQALTRAEAADMLVASMEIMDARNADHSLFSWLK